MANLVTDMFPDDLVEIENVIYLIFEYAENFDIMDETNLLAFGPWVPIMPWLRERIDIYDPRDSDDLDWQDVERSVIGWQQSLVALYVALLDFSTGKFWADKNERDAAERELSHKFLVVKSYIDDGKSYQVHIKAQKLRKLKAARVKGWRQEAVTMRDRYRKQGKSDRDMASLIGKAVGKSAGTVRVFLKARDNMIARKKE